MGCQDSIYGCCFLKHLGGTSNRKKRSFQTRVNAEKIESLSVCFFSSANPFLSYHHRENGYFFS